MQTGIEHEGALDARTAALRRRHGATPTERLLRACRRPEDCTKLDRNLIMPAAPATACEGEGASSPRAHPMGPAGPARYAILVAGEPDEAICARRACRLPAALFHRSPPLRPASALTSAALCLPCAARALLSRCSWTCWPSSRSSSPPTCLPPHQLEMTAAAAAVILPLPLPPLRLAQPVQPLRLRSGESSLPSKGSCPRLRSWPASRAS